MEKSARASSIALFLISLSFLYIYHGFVLYVFMEPAIPDYYNVLGRSHTFRKQEQPAHTQFYALRLTKYLLPNKPYSIYPTVDYRIPTRLADAPAHISAIDNQNFLLIDRRGNFYHLKLKPGADGEDNLHLRKLAAVFPINWREFNAQEENHKVPKWNFRITDIYIETENGRQSLYVGHHFWNTRKKCVATNVTKLIGDLPALMSNDPAPKWHTLYEAAPCLPIGKDGKFAGHQSGGRIIGLDDRHILFSVGDYALAAGTDSPQDPDKSYGKIWKIHRHHGTAEIFSIGHRNPQGLYHAADGTIWETEHGPQSGDELNKIIPGRNYGWPYALYGVGYGSHVLASAKTQNSHHGYEQPIFAWTPSIAVSNLIEIEQDLFPLWQHSLLVSSLKTRSLFRLQLHNDRVIYSEPIHIGERIRDITETPNGEIFMWTGSRQLIRLRPVAFQSKENETLEQAGKRAFFRCLGCHSITKDAGHGVGPNLHDVYGGKIARHDQYPYSPALRSRTAQRWSGDHLDRFLEDPQAFAPGSTMQMKTPDAAERRALIYYLKNL